MVVRLLMPMSVNSSLKNTDSCKVPRLKEIHIAFSHLCDRLRMSLGNAGRTFAQAILSFLKFHHSRLAIELLGKIQLAWYFGFCQEVEVHLCL